MQSFRSQQAYNRVRDERVADAIELRDQNAPSYPNCESAVFEVATRPVR